MSTFNACMTDLSYHNNFPASPEQKEFTINHFVRINLSGQTGMVWPKASGI